jgi:hypothetical protein
VPDTHRLSQRQHSHHTPAPQHSEYQFAQLVQFEFELQFFELEFLQFELIQQFQFFKLQCELQFIRQPGLQQRRFAQLGQPGQQRRLSLPLRTVHRGQQ